MTRHLQDHSPRTANTQKNAGHETLLEINEARNEKAEKPKELKKTINEAKKTNRKA